MSYSYKRPTRTMTPRHGWPVGLGISKEQRDIIRTSLSRAELENLPASERVEILMRNKEAEARRTDAFWNAVSGFATVAVPLATFLGFKAFSK